MMLSKCCTRCKEEKPLADYHRNKRRIDGYMSLCKMCMKTQRKLEYTGLKAEQKRKYSSERRKAHQDVINAAKRIGCLVCDEKEICCMDFHHVDSTQKEFILGGENAGRSLVKILAEIDKCVVLCANCHRKVHAGIITLPMSC